jgi:hypothetical protein
MAHFLHVIGWWMTGMAEAAIIMLLLIGCRLVPNRRPRYGDRIE